MNEVSMKNNYSTLIKSFLFALLLAPFSMNLAHAYSTQDVVVSGNGDKVRTGSGDCLRSKWDVGNDRCIDEQESQPQIKVVRKVIGMDERTVYFNFDSSVITEDEKYKLNALAHTLKEHNIKAVKILGFTDRIGSDAYNYALSKKRADAVKNYLDSKVAIDSSILIERGLGKQQQIKPCDGVKGKELINCLKPNRRVVVEVDYLDKVSN
ncbi:hypothetical protein NF27_DT00500 [Candidatus Jidaibacter acanthamoeba]|uniref:OmpA-like domain-containing protein n=2 Tax=Candidatus Jidaibacter acanthamoebae TaxID=86105 RepID=A0A0C1MZ45_9RICK|nr:hypothetical protein NF27_DT00500 [Candidatus Jidaibacter acanthamoeba]